MNRPSREQIAAALIAEHLNYLVECTDEDNMSLEEYTAFVSTLSYDELVFETSTDDTSTLEEYVNYYSR